MTLDDLIERLQEIRRDYPAAASAIVRRPIDLRAGDVTYEHGQILIGQPPQYPRGFR
jgi:hypothetical protein